ncbi:type II toxin-antitoxin system HipA family toxin [Piscinibacter terrae]|uniref:Type II toxin-antitoxin system HipA family toxin n=1 Tax=Piscinibacter terrae TaxID=2496871 RepID=A0A3N7HQC0_9BURK|nr:HipA domain-containing protein [Albitalea terrae]RQP23346.1 type II toxin-antitoxin system HipA family toxin [Albitalea terrae]
MNRLLSYPLIDRLYLWWLGQSSSPVCIGELNTERAKRGVSLRYTHHWLLHGFALSEDLPLIDSEFLPDERDAAPGAVDDARPDHWGERIIRLVYGPSRLSLLEYLYFAGDERFGALGVSTSPATYLPRQPSPIPRLGDIAKIYMLIEKVLSDDPIDKSQRWLIATGAAMGGARPKALVDIDGEQWLVKFSDGDIVDTPLVEHATMTLAAQADIVVAPTRVVRLRDGHAVAVRRFDRQGPHRVHVQSAKVALKATGGGIGYPQLAQLLLRRGVVEGGVAVTQMHELFRRMVFNILIDNTDDHEKNHALIASNSNRFSLSPAFDVLPSGQALGYQQIRVGEDDTDSTLDNAMSMHQVFGLDRDAAFREIATVTNVVTNWQKHFAACGVTKRDIDSLTAQIDRPFLKDQRDAYA